MRSGKRQGWEVVRADGGRVCCLRKFGLCLEGNRKPQRVLRRVHLEKLLHMHYGEWSAGGNEIMLAWGD